MVTLVNTSVTLHSSDKNNYMPIAVVMALSKIFELCIMRKVETQLITSDNQFGFKREQGTDLCIFTVKSVIKHYNLHTNHVYPCFLTLLKLMIVLITGHCSENYSTDQFIFLVVRILMFWHTKQELCIRWEAEMSPYFTISNGV